MINTLKKPTIIIINSVGPKQKNPFSTSLVPINVHYTFEIV